MHTQEPHCVPAAFKLSPEPGQSCQGTCPLCVCVCVRAHPFSRNHFSPNEDTPCWVAWKQIHGTAPIHEDINSSADSLTFCFLLDPFSSRPFVPTNKQTNKTNKHLLKVGRLEGACGICSCRNVSFLSSFFLLRLMPTPQTTAGLTMCFLFFVCFFRASTKVADS